MRVLYITQTQDMPGADRSLLQLMKELRANHGVEPFVVKPRVKLSDAHTLRSECFENDIPFIIHKMSNFKRHEGCSWIEKLYFIMVHAYSVLTLLWKLRRERFDLIHSNTSVTDLGAYMSRSKGAPHIWHLREFGKEDLGLVSCLGEGYERWTYRRSERFIAISDVIKRAFLRVVDAERIVTIYNGILPPKENMDAVHEPGVLNVCMVGRIEPNKNQLEALKAIAQLKEQGVPPIHLYFIGRIKDEAYHVQMQHFVAQHQLTDVVSFLGVRFDVPELLKKMDVGLMLSTSEAFGRVTVEFQMQNVAVVASDAGANAELIESGRTGFLYPLGQPESLAVADGRNVVTPLHLCGDGSRIDFMFRESLKRADNELFDDLLLKKNLNQSYETGEVCAACWFMPVSVLKEVGGFNPLFFQYGEDNNYYTRLVYHKRKMILAVRARMFHDRKIHGNVQLYNKKRLRIMNLVTICNPGLGVMRRVKKLLLLWMSNPLSEIGELTFLLKLSARIVNSIRKERMVGANWLEI